MPTDLVLRAVTQEIKAESPEIEPEDADVLGPDDEADPNAEGVQGA